MVWKLYWEAKRVLEMIVGSQGKDLPLLRYSKRTTFTAKAAVFSGAVRLLLELKGKRTSQKRNEHVEKFTEETHDFQGTRGQAGAGDGIRRADTLS